MTSHVMDQQGLLVLEIGTGERMTDSPQDAAAEQLNEADERFMRRVMQVPEGSALRGVAQCKHCRAVSVFFFDSHNAVQERRSTYLFDITEKDLRRIKRIIGENVPHV